MTITSHARGHKIEFNIAINKWVYSDTKESVENNERTCKKCGKYPTSEGYDACLGYIPGAISGCCGHGVEDKYIIYKEDNIL
ncbi:MAG TPA: hypothetical protein GX708_16980 [Gallicola sp.]|nr:hypothetical protein [Gallicola sp.]